MMIGKELMKIRWGLPFANILVANILDGMPGPGDNCRTTLIVATPGLATQCMFASYSPSSSSIFDTNFMW
jgi:hypothetical protein